jgi:hypothetical protein
VYNTGSVAVAILTWIEPIYERGNGTPILVVGIVASILLAIGLLPPYWEIWKRKGRVIGINWVSRRAWNATPLTSTRFS